MGEIAPHGGMHRLMDTQTIGATVVYYNPENANENIRYKDHGW